MYEIEKKIILKQIEYDNLSKQKLEIRIKLGTPFSTFDYIRLDGILAYFSLQNIIGHDFQNFIGKHEDKVLHAPLPLEKSGIGDKWFWCVSFSFYVGETSDSINRWKKRWCDINDYLVKFPDKKLPRIDHKASFFKAYDMPIVLKSSKEIVFYCIGNKIEINKLLSNLKFIGKKRSQGYGSVVDIAVSETEVNYSCRDDQGRPTRSIPMQKDDIDFKKNNHFHVIKTGYRPPYWHQENIDFCYKIGDLVLNN